MLCHLEVQNYRFNLFKSEIPFQPYWLLNRDSFSFPFSESSFLEGLFWKEGFEIGSTSVCVISAVLDLFMLRENMKFMASSIRYNLKESWVVIPIFTQFSLDFVSN